MDLLDILVWPLAIVVSSCFLSRIKVTIYSAGGGINVGGDDDS